MKILYDTLTGNVRRFIRKLPIEALPITDEQIIKEDFILITYTTGLGQIPLSTRNFLRQNGAYLKGVASSGNRNFGTYFAVSADEIASEFDVPIVSKFELSGTPTDVDNFMEGLKTIETY